MEMAIIELAKEARKSLDEGRFVDAYNQVENLKKQGDNYYVSYLVSALLIDISQAMRKETILLEGLNLLKANFEKIIKEDRLVQSAYYNLANGYSSLFYYERIRNQYAALFKSSSLDKAKELYRKAIGYGLSDKMLASEIYVNMGNCFDQLGRVVDALDCYETAIRWKPDHGMALGNKAKALYYYSKLAGQFENTILIESYNLFIQALKFGVVPEAIETFTKSKDKIRSFFSDKSFLDNPLDYPTIEVKGESDIEKHLINYCLKNKLYLNICNYCQKCNAAIGDRVVIKRMFTQPPRSNEIEDNRFLYLSSIINQMKQDYIAARFLLVLSKYEGLNLSFVDKNVRIIDTMDCSVHNIYIQMMKIAFKCFYDILDKIALFLNEYLRIGMDKFKLYYSNIWYKNFNNKIIWPIILETNSFSLNALFNLHMDLLDGPFITLRKIRNRLTHGIVNIRMFQEKETYADMKDETLFNHSMELAKIVRSAILYLLMFVYNQEEKKERELNKISVTQIVPDLPDHLKSSR